MAGTFEFTREDAALDEVRRWLLYSANYRLCPQRPEADTASDVGHQMSRDGDEV